MSAREFSKVSPAVWRSGRFHRLQGPVTPKLVYFYFVTNTHVNSAGCYALPDLYACADLGCEAEAYTIARDALLAGEMIDFDPATSEILVERWFRHNPPMNPNHHKGTSRLVSEIESDRLREKAEAALTEAWQAYQIRKEEDETRRQLEVAQKEAARSQRGYGTLQPVGASGHLLNTRLMKGVG
ncbi:hypothetical protein [Neoaquamicrobium sediminum]|uniref:Uncharacterized protein n=1 Tax=Neoaquamicrobium sediminum TaxID=1849104 RepID=A0ABV3WUV4_9HYPH